MYLMGAIFSLSEKRVFAVAVNHDGFYRILRASVNVKMKAKCANQIQKVHKRRADMAGVTHKGIIGGFPSRGLLTRTFPPFHELKCAWVRHPDGEQEFGAAGFRSALTSEKGGKVQLFHNELFSLPFRSAKAEWFLKLTSMGTEVDFSDRSALAERKGQYDCCRISKRGLLP